MQVVLTRSGTQRLSGLVQMDDAYLGGEYAEHTNAKFPTMWCPTSLEKFIRCLHLQQDLFLA